MLVGELIDVVLLLRVICGPFHRFPGPSAVAAISFFFHGAAPVAVVGGDIWVGRVALASGGRAPLAGIFSGVLTPGGGVTVSNAESLPCLVRGLFDADEAGSGDVGVVDELEEFGRLDIGDGLPTATCLSDNLGVSTCSVLTYSGRAGGDFVAAEAAALREQN